jgi:acetolactate synthase-1/2/3 large subunit
VLIILGSRLNIRQVSYNWSSFARSAYKIWVDIDELELKKPSVKPDFPIHADLADFIPGLLSLSYRANDEHESWLSWCRERKDKYPIVLDEYRVEKSKINPYVFMEALFNKIPENRTVVSGNGSACVIGFQTAYIKSGQRFWTNSGCATMGYDLPGAIGAYLADPERKDVISLAGDGSIMMNLQELETIAGNQFPIKIFIINNNGYVSIFQTHKNFFGGEVGGGPNSGVTFPKFEKLAIAFGFPYFRCEKQSNLDEVINQVLLEKGPVICEIIIDETQVFSPKLSSKQLPDGKIISPSLEDLSPFLSREELEANMIIPLQSE